MDFAGGAFDCGEQPRHRESARWRVPLEIESHPGDRREQPGHHAFLSLRISSWVSSVTTRSPKARFKISPKVSSGQSRSGTRFLGRKYRYLRSLLSVCIRIHSFLPISRISCALVYQSPAALLAEAAHNPRDPSQPNQGASITARNPPCRSSKVHSGLSM